MLPFPLRNRHFIVFLVLLVAITLGLNYFIRRTHVEMLRQELMNLSAIAALSVDGADLEQLLQGRQEDTPEYRQLAAKLEQVLRQNNRFTSIHLLRRTGDPSVYALIADADGKGDSAKPGEMYQAWLVPAMFEAFGGPSADKTLMTDQWGSFLSGYAPVYDEGGKAIAIIGVDYDANQVVADLNRYTYLIIIYMFITLAMLFYFSDAIAKRIISRLQRVTVEIDNLANGRQINEIADGEKDHLTILATQVTRLAEKISTERMEMVLSAVASLVAALEAKDRYTSGHSVNVAALASFMAQKMDLVSEQCFEINLAAVLHDIGKIGVIDHILNKPGKLTEEEWRHVKQHPVIGWKIIAGIDSLKDVAEMIKYHHAHWDGRGYPEALAADNIPLGSRIIAVADAYQAMVSDRPYRKGKSHKEVIGEIRRCSGTQFDPAVVEIFVRYQAEIEKLADSPYSGAAALAAKEAAATLSPQFESPQ